ncbi:hypothetical protein [Pseudonocardia sp. HH130630-07]|uniref:hypothetical protein n=1 Tax=Pseudonocardia sp. HH130630-07 TaxID=1690815 RepID=UPI000814ED8F|nr:hypothetical protein [Pseudonocardia sp. HH130630-07]ANY07697.1 hypothetical protein AFB00_16930 [Pseudonocardia sp. HH130630-07]
MYHRVRVANLAEEQRSPEVYGRLNSTGRAVELLRLDDGRLRRSLEDLAAATGRRLPESGDLQSALTRVLKRQSDVQPWSREEIGDDVEVRALVRAADLEEEQRSPDKYRLLNSTFRSRHLLRPDGELRPLLVARASAAGRRLPYFNTLLSAVTDIVAGSGALRGLSSAQEDPPDVQALLLGPGRDPSGTLGERSGVDDPAARPVDHDALRDRVYRLLGTDAGAWGRVVTAGDLSELVAMRVQVHAAQIVAGSMWAESVGEGGATANRVMFEVVVDRVAVELLSPTGGDDAARTLARDLVDRLQREGLIDGADPAGTGAGEPSAKRRRTSVPAPDDVAGEDTS